MKKALLSLFSAIFVPALLVGCNTASVQPDKPPLTVAANAAKPTHCSILDGYTAQDELMLGSPLSFAVSSNNLAQAECLLKMGKDANKLDGVGTTPLIAAINDSNTEMVRLLLKHRANPNAAQRDWERPLDIARAKGNATIIKLLEQGGATSANERADREYQEMKTLENASRSAMSQAEQEYLQQQRDYGR